MEKLPLISGRNLVKILGKIGYCEVRQRGSHMRLCCPNRKSVTVPDYKIIDRSLVVKILRDAEITNNDFFELMNE